MKELSIAASKIRNLIRVCVRSFEKKAILFEEKNCISQCLAKHYEVEKIVGEEMRHLGAEKNTENNVLNPFIK